MWNATTYGQFLDERTRPAKNLLAAMDDTFYPSTVYDLGCGPGNSTAMLKKRWPKASIFGLDSSDEMLQQARLAHPNLNFVAGDMADFSSSEQIDCLFANAALQWLDHHETLFPKLIQYIASNGVFAVQMPNNYHQPTHQITIDLLQGKKSWQSYLKYLRYGKLDKPLYDPTVYYDILYNFGLIRVTCFTVEYFLERTHHQEVFDWVKATGLRPVLQAMNQEEQAVFMHDYVAKIKIAYPEQSNQKVLMPFERIFMVGYK